jgi:hypothetical protein
MIQTFPPGVRVLWTEPFGDRKVVGVVIGPAEYPHAPLVAIRIHGRTTVCARRDRLVRR